MKKRILAMLLAVMLVLTGLPIAAAATDAELTPEVVPVTGLTDAESNAITPSE